MGWSVDGSRLLFASDRSGAVGLWQLPVGDGRPQGPPDLIKSSVEGAPLGISRNGALYSLVHHPSFNSAVSSNIHVASFDFESGKLLSPPVVAVQSFIGTNNMPAWAPDGKSLAYVSMRVELGEGSGAAQSAIIAIRSTDTGDVRELRPEINLYPPMVRWSADGLSLLTHGRDVKGRQGLYRIDARTGAVAVVAHSASDRELRSPVESPDGKRIYYIHDYFDRPDREFAITERDLANGHERDVIRGRGPFYPSNASVLSPDGQQIVVRTSDATTNSSALVVVPVHGGEPKEVIRLDAPRQLNIHSWTPDGQGILVKVSSQNGGEELWNTPINGGAPRKLDLKVEGMTPFSVHPDGRQIAYGLSERAKEDEVWVLENFLPAAAAPNKPAKK